MTARVYDVEWHPEAEEDLLTKPPDSVARQLIEVAGAALDYHVPPDGGAVHPYYWRRGLTPEQRRTLHENPDSQSDTGTNPWDYVLVYKLVPHISRKRYLILKVYHNSEIHGAALSIQFEELRIS